MKSNSKFLIIVLMIIVSTSMISAANFTSYGPSNGNGGSTNLRPINWIETDSGLPSGICQENQNHEKAGQEADL